MCAECGRWEAALQQTVDNAEEGVRVGKAASVTSIREVFPMQQQ